MKPSDKAVTVLLSGSVIFDLVKSAGIGRVALKDTRRPKTPAGQSNDEEKVFIPCLGGSTNC